MVLLSSMVEGSFPFLEARMPTRVPALEILENRPYPEVSDNLGSKGSDYELELTIGMRGKDPGELLLPIQIEVQGDRVLVVDAGNRRIQEYSADGRHLSVLPLKELKNPLQVRALGEEIFVVDAGCPCIRVYDKEYRQIRTIGTAGVSSGQLNHPNSMILDPRGLIWVADDKNNRIEVFSREPMAHQSSHYFMNIDEYLPETVLRAPKSLAYYFEQDEVLVVDSGSAAILAFDRNGNFTREMSQGGKEGGKVMMPQALGVDGLGNLYIADHISQKILKVSGEGRMMGDVGMVGQFPVHLMADPKHPTPVQITRTSAFQPKDSTLNYPLGITISPRGDLWIADWGNNAIKMFSVGNFRKGLQAYREQNFHLAIQYFNRCHERNPAYHLVEFYLSMCHYYLGELNPVFEKRLEWYAKARSHFESLLLKGKIGRFEDDDLERRAAYYLARVGSVLTDR